MLASTFSSVLLSAAVVTAPLASTGAASAQPGLVPVAASPRERVLTGLPTSAAMPPTLTLSAANAPTRIPAPVNLRETSPLLVTRGAHLSRRVDPLSAHSDSITPISSTAFQAYSVEIRTDAPTLEIGFRGVGGNYRVWVDGRPTSLVPTDAPRGGAFYRLTAHFPNRATRAVRFESDESRFTQFTVDRSADVTAAAPAGTRAVLLGDSFTEGSRAAARFTAFGQKLCALSGWDDCWASGSGGTGYLAIGAAFPGRVKYRDRVVNDVLAWRPDVVVVTGGRNDGPFSVAQVQAESRALFLQIRAALPTALVIATSTFPASSAEANNSKLLAFSKAIKAGSAGLADHYLDVMGTQAYITGSGNAGSPTGDGNADVLTSADGVHPTQAGHDELGRQLFARLRAQAVR